MIVNFMIQVDMYHAGPLLPMKDEGIVETALQALNTVRGRRSKYPIHQHTYTPPVKHYIEHRTHSCIIKVNDTDSRIYVWASQAH